MPIIDPDLIKSERIVISVSPKEYDRWDRVAKENDMRVTEFVRHLVSRAVRQLEQGK